MFDLNDGRRILARTPAVLDALLRGLPDSWTRVTEGPDTWSPFDIMGHLVHGEETDWIGRARILLEHGPDRAFDPFDREAQFSRFADASLDALLDRFHELRTLNLEALDGMALTPADLRRQGRHPAFGAVTLDQLLATWVAHDLSHVRQICRVMAKRWRDEVGPWATYLTVMSE